MTHTYSNAVSGATAIPASLVSSQSVLVAPRKRAHVRLGNDWLAHWQPILSPKALSIYTALLKRRGKNESAFPSHERLAQDTNMSVSSVKRALKELKKHSLCSWVKRTERTRKGRHRQTSNAYFLASFDLPSPSNLSAPPRSKRATKQVESRKRIKEQQHAGREIFSPAPPDDTVPEEDVVVVSSSKKEEACNALSPEQQHLYAQVVNEGVTPWVARQVVQKYPAAQIENQLRWLDARNPRSRAAILVKSLHEEWSAPAAKKAPESPPKGQQRPALTPEEQSRREEERRAWQSQQEAAAQRVLARLPESQQTYLLRCVELEGRTLAQVMDSQEHFLFHGELRRADAVRDEPSPPIPLEVAAPQSDENGETQYWEPEDWEIELDPNAPRLVTDFERDEELENQLAHNAACEAVRDQLPEEVTSPLRQRICRLVAHDASNAHEVRCRMWREIIARDYPQLVALARQALDDKKPDAST